MIFKTRFNYSQILSRVPKANGRTGTKFFLAAAFALAASSCNKESDLGLDVQPENDLLLVGVQDTTTLRTYTVREDSARSDEAPVCLLGAINDPVFGKSTAGIFSQFMIPNNLLNIDFGTESDLVLDSTVLSLSYKIDFYGDTTTQQTVRVYQMTESIYKDSNYYSNQVKQHYTPAPLAVKTFSPRPHTRLNVDGSERPAHLRIPLDPSFGQIIFNQSGTSNLQNNTNWLNFCKGFYIAPDPNPSGEGSIMHFSMTDSLTKITLYYRNVVTLDTLKFSFTVPSGAAAYYNYFTHDYSTATFNLATQDTVNGESVAYIQGMCGLKTAIKMPYLSKWKDLGPIAVNKAELVIQADPGYINDLHAANVKLYLTALDSSGNSLLLIDMLTSLGSFGGSFNSTNSEYRINLPRHMQRMIEESEPNFGFFLKEIDPVQSPRRTVIGGGSSPSPALKMYLRIIYTKIN
ncbi:MAG: hypothetical protein FD123_592 [Bacteroidetes bacterium]|nr:MAG: hypothetical protein FD123_592 [Bacteroidota bacterium]